jgi:hypothetical protein
MYRSMYRCMVCVCKCISLFDFWTAMYSGIFTRTRTSVDRIFMPSRVGSLSEEFVWNDSLASRREFTHLFFIIKSLLFFFFENAVSARANFYNTKQDRYWITRVVHGLMSTRSEACNYLQCAGHFGGLTHGIIFTIINAVHIRTYVHLRVRNLLISVARTHFNYEQTRHVVMIINYILQIFE